MKNIFVALTLVLLSFSPLMAEEQNENSDINDNAISMQTINNNDDIIASPMDEPLTEVAMIEKEVNFSATHPLLKLTPDKSELIRLPSAAASVIVGNPNHISVLLDTPDTIIVIPRAQGASHFSVVDNDGNILMQRHVIVAAQDENYVRIRRSCNANARDCQPTSVYFCPNMCHEVNEGTQRRR